MRYINIIISLLFVVTLQACKFTGDNNSKSENIYPQQKLRVLTYNIWDPADVPFWQKHAKGYPYKKVIKYLTEDKSDLILMQEVTLENSSITQSYQKIRNKLIQIGYHYTAFLKMDGTAGYVPGSKNKGYPLAIFSKHPIEETYTIRTKNGKTMAKGVLAAKITLSGHPLYICNTHLSIGDTNTNDEVNKVALPFINSLTDNQSVIFGGDWNSPPASEFPDSSKIIGDYTYSSQTTQYLIDAGFKDAWSILSTTKNIGKGITCPGQDNFIKRVDQIYYRGKNLKPTNAFVKPNLWKYIHLKDHNAFIVDFMIVTNQ